MLLSLFDKDHFCVDLVYCLHCTLAAAQCFVIGPVCGFVAVFVCGSVTTITRNCVRRSSPNFPFSALTLLVGDRKGIRSVKKTGCWFVGGDDRTGALHDL